MSTTYKFLKKITACAAAAVVLISAVPCSTFAATEQQETYKIMDSDRFGDTSYYEESAEKPVGGLAESYGIRLEDDTKSNQVLNYSAAPIVNSTLGDIQFDRYSSSDIGYEMLGQLDNGEALQQVYLMLYNALEEVYANHSEPTTVSSVTGVSCIVRFGKDYGQDFDITVDELDLVNRILVYYNPQFYWLNRSYYYYDDDNGIATGYIGRFLEDFETAESRIEFDKVVLEKVLEYAAAADGKTTDYDKIMAVYTKLMNEIEYAYIEGTQIADSSDPNVHSIVSPFGNEKRAVCDGYSLVISIVLNYLDIDNFVVLGKSIAGDSVGAHAWIAIKLDDGKYYYFDPTWDDGDEIDPDNYTYFALTDEIFSYTHKSCDPDRVEDEPFNVPLPEIADEPFDITTLRQSAETGETFTYQGMTFKTYEDGSCALVDAADASGQVIIPTAANGYTVVEIETGAFAKNYSITSVSIPSSVEIIRKGAFEYCTALEEVILVEGLEYIERNAFAGCSSLTAFNAPKGLKTIGNEAFLNCTALESVYIPSSVDYIGNETFVNTDISYFNMQCYNSYYTAIDGVIYNYYETALAFYPNSYGKTEFTVPDSVIDIGKSAFYGDNDLRSITIGSNVYEIGASAFEDSSLVNVYMDEGTMKIKEYAFYNCRNLKTIQLPSTINGIAIKAVGFVYDLTSMTDIVADTTYALCDDSTYAAAYCEAFGLNRLNYDGSHAHDYVAIEVVEPSYAADGYTLYECTICGDTYKDNFTAKLTLTKPTIKISSADSSTIKLSWNKVADADGYVVYRQDGTTWKRLGTTTSTSYTYKSLSANKTYKLAVRAYKMVDGVEYKSDFTTANDAVTAYTAPAKPSIKISSADSSTIKLSWNKVTGAQGYVVYRLDGTTWKRLGTTTSTSYTYKSLSANKTYKLAVRAYKVVGGVEYKSTFTAANDAVTAYTAPARPTIKIASAGSNTIKLSWNKVTGAQGYVVYRLDGSTWKRLGTTTSTSYTYKNLSANKTYKLAVRAYKVVGGVEYKSTFTAANDAVMAYTAPAKPTIKIASAGSNTIKLSWNKVTGAQGYVVYRLDGSTWKRLGTTTSTSYTYKNLSANKTYKLAVRAYKVVGGVEYKSTFTAANDAVTAYTAPAKPTITSATSTKNTVTLKWNKVSGAKGYIVYKKVNGSWVRQGVTTSTSYTFKSLKSGTTYTFAVKPYKVVNGTTLNGTYVSKSVKTK